MADRTCSYCNSPVTAAHPNARYCSESCKDAKKYQERTRVACVECGGPTGYMASRPPVSPPKCRACRRSAHGTEPSYNKRGCRCAECRRANAEAARAYAERRRESGNPIKPAVPPVPCVDCGSLTRRRQSRRGPGVSRCKPCGGSARKRFASNRARAAAKLEAAALGVEANLKWPFTSGACAQCGEVFTRRGVTAYCSPECRSEARGGDTGNWISRRRRLAIYVLDNWTCQLCDEPVDPDADPLSDWFPSLDHIVPRSLGEPDHRSSNLRTTHRWCNTARGAGDGDSLFERLEVAA